MMSGGPVDYSAAKADGNVGAIMWCGYPGQSGGDAIAGAVFGKHNRFGKLTQTWYPDAFTKQVSLTDMGMRPNPATGNPGRSHRFYTGTPVWKFGEGMSYTRFTHELDVVAELRAADVRADLAARPLRTAARVAAHARVTVRNAGAREGDEVALLFAAPPQERRGVSGAPLQSLVAFERVSLAAGATAQLSFALTTLDLSYATRDGAREHPAGAWAVWVGADPKKEGAAAGEVNLS